MPSERAKAMQRVRVGLAGLAAVVLLIVLASAVMRTVTREAPVVAVGAPRSDVVANMVASNAQGEVGAPLAELGVAAGAAAPRR